MLAGATHPWVSQLWMPTPNPGPASETFPNPPPPWKEPADEGPSSSPLPHSLGASPLHVPATERSPLPQPALWTGLCPGFGPW